MSEQITRRKLMRVGAGTAALGAVGSLSGCSAIQDLIPGGGGSLGSYTDWVYEPDTFESDREGISGFATSYEAILSNSGNLADSVVRDIKGRNYPNLGIDPENVSMDLSLPEGTVITGSFDTEAVKSELSSGPVDTPSTPEDRSGFGSAGSAEYESDTEYEDYEIFVEADADDSETDAIAVGDGTIIVAERAENRTNESSAVDAPDVAEGIIDTGTGGSDRLVDDSDTFATLTDTLNNGVSVSYSLFADPIGSDDGGSERIKAGEFEDMVADGVATSINGDTTERQYVFVYDSESDVNESDVQDWVEANNSDGTLSDLSDLSVNTNGNTATVTGTKDTVEY